MATFEYRVASIDFHGRISVEGQETLIGNERRTAFVRRYLDGLGAEGWELVGIQPMSPHTAYYIFKRPGRSGEAGAASQGEATVGYGESAYGESAAETSPLGTL